MDRWWWLVALGSGVVTAVVVVGLGARATKESLTVSGASMRAGFDRISAMTEAQLNALATQWEHDGYVMAEAKIKLAAERTAQLVLQNEYGITQGFITDLQKLQARLARLP